MKFPNRSINTEKRATIMLHEARKYRYKRDRAKNIVLKNKLTKKYHFWYCGALEFKVISDNHRCSMCGSIPIFSGVRLQPMAGYFLYCKKCDSMHFISFEVVLEEVVDQWKSAHIVV